MELEKMKELNLTQTRKLNKIEDDWFVEWIYYSVRYGEMSAKEARELIEEKLLEEKK